MELNVASTEIILRTASRPLTDDSLVLRYDGLADSRPLLISQI